MKNELSNKQLAKAIELAENGAMVTLVVIKMLPAATEAELSKQAERVYDAMQYPEAA